MAFHPDAATCRRIPLDFLTKGQSAPAGRSDIEAATETPASSPPAPAEPLQVPSHWVDMLHDDISLDALFG